MNTYIYAGGSSLLTMKDNDIKNFDTISNHYRNMKECDCCEPCVTGA